MDRKVIVLNGKRFVVGKSKIKITKSYISTKIKKLTSKIKACNRKREKIFKRNPTTSSRKRRNTKTRKIIEED